VWHACLSTLIVTSARLSTLSVTSGFAINCIFVSVSAIFTLSLGEEQPLSFVLLVLRTHVHQNAVDDRVA